MKTRKFYCFIAIFLLLLFKAGASNYYFSANGNDAYTRTEAQNPLTPWKTLAKLNTIFAQFSPGDSILFKRGDSFFGFFEIPISGLAGMPIVFSAYGTGAKPVITGFHTLHTWTSLGNGIWECDGADLLTDVNMVVIDGKNYAVGRYPNADAADGGYLTVDSHAGALSITSNGLNGGPNWNGGEVVIRKERWIIDKCPIIEHSGNTITYGTTSGYAANDRFGFFIQRHPSTLDKYGEWYFDPATKKMKIYFGSTDPNTHEIKASAVNTLVTINARNNFVFDNLEFQGSNVQSLRMFVTENIVISNCTFQFSGGNAMAGNSTSAVTIKNSNISHTNNNAIDFNYNCNATTIEDNTVSTTGIFPGMGKSSDGGYTGIYITGNNNTLSYNRVDSSGYNGIVFFGDNITVRNNFVNYCVFVKDDGGGICTGGHDASFANGAKRIINNIVLNVKGAGYGTNSPDYNPAHGFYIDDRSVNVELDGNTAAYSGESGFYIHNSRNVNAVHNTSFANHTQLFLNHDYNAPDDPIRDLTLQDNVLFSKTVTQGVADYRTKSNDIPSWGPFDNNYYCRPVNDFETVSVDVSSNLNNPGLLDLALWKTRYGMDVNSKGSPVTIPLSNVSGTVGSNKFSNSSFNVNISGLDCFSGTNNCNSVWTISGGLDGGCLQNTAVSSGSNSTVSSNIPIGAVAAGKSYLLRYSSLASTNGKTIKVYLRKKSSPYTLLSNIIISDLYNSRKEQEAILLCITDEADANLIMEVQETGFTYWLDNITLFEATVTTNNIADFIRFEYNDTKQVKNIVLDDAYIDAKGRFRSGLLSLDPFTSIVLIKTIGTILPVAFIDFTADTREEKNILQWKTTHEKDVQYYQVERSADGKRFAAIGKVLPNNKPEEVFTYEFTDNTPLIGNNYYRIREIDKNNRSTYSKTIKLGNVAHASMEVRPNPVLDKMYISLNEERRVASGALGVYTTDGKAIRKISCTFTDNKTIVDVSDLPANIYMLRLNTSDNSYFEKIIKQ